VSEPSADPPRRISVQMILRTARVLFFAGRWWRAWPVWLPFVAYSAFFVFIQPLDGFMEPFGGRYRIAVTVVDAMLEALAAAPMRRFMLGYGAGTWRADAALVRYLACSVLLFALPQAVQDTLTQLGQSGDSGAKLLATFTGMAVGLVMIVVWLQTAPWPTGLLMGETALGYSQSADRMKGAKTGLAVASVLVALPAILVFGLLQYLHWHSAGLVATIGIAALRVAVTTVFLIAFNAGAVAIYALTRPRAETVFI